MRIIISALMIMVMSILVFGCSHQEQPLTAQQLRAQADQAEYQTLTHEINRNYKKRYLITTQLSAVNTKKLIDLGYNLDYFESGCVLDRNPLSRCTFTEISW